MEKIVALCKRRGFVFPSSEIYGGVGSTYDFGHYGVLLKGNVKNEWWRSMLQERDDIVALDSAILQHPRVWEASGHLSGFTDPLVDCRACGQRFRADHLAELQRIDDALAVRLDRRELDVRPRQDQRAQRRDLVGRRGDGYQRDRIALRRSMGGDRLQRPAVALDDLVGLGWGDADFANDGSDALVDAIVAWGDAAEIRARVDKHLANGADHVCVQVLRVDFKAHPLAEWRQLAPALL